MLDLVSQIYTKQVHVCGDMAAGPSPLNGSIPALALVYVIMTRGQISHKLWRDTQFGMPLSSPTYCDSL